jgi:hypothetical protein
MVARSALGEEGAPFEMDIERGKIDEFARAVGATSEHHFREERAAAPATFLTTLFFWEKRVSGANPWNLVEMSEERGMHAEQEYIFHGPPPKAGDRLVCKSTITDMWDKQSRSGDTLTFVKMVTEFRDGVGQLVAEAILTGVERQL